jgi:hypothetical protein
VSNVRRACHLPRAPESGSTARRLVLPECALHVYGARLPGPSSSRGAKWLRVRVPGRRSGGPSSYGCGRCTRNDVIHLVEASIAAPKASLAALQERLEEVTKERERLAAEIRAKVTWGADLLTERDSLAEALKAIEALPRTRPMTEGAHELVSVQEAKDIARAALQKPEQSVEGR